ncbi:conserved hypothetical protein [Alteracholeplasma palmae J233]|uniref:DUF998 domain-containing protein n=1 Tax=Alteracholeplasma palmae (strain ATCC 49389 / J233) TaxID=1318466 RepID=U4KRR5_ALTPJ|nr:DUF998 domain-containing protein [Alteracholeplasma palmae]CCV64391.1 conserved hypothetical protein [Alteracholeplasma palmae J233]
MTKNKIIGYLGLTGLFAFIFYLLHDVIGGLNYPNYNWLKQAISDLTSSSAPSKSIADIYVIIYGILTLICCLVLCLYFKKKNDKLTKIGVYIWSVMNLINVIGYNLFPLEEAGNTSTSFKSTMHLIVTGIVVLLSIISLVVLIIGGYKNRMYKLITNISIITISLMIFGAIGTSLLPKSIFGLVERFSAYSAVLFTLFLGIYIFYQAIVKKEKI